MPLGVYNGAGSGVTKLLLHLEGNSTDSSGNGNNGTDSNMVYGLGNGRFGQGVVSNGVASNISIPTTVSWGSNNYTIAFWVSPTTFTASRFLFSHRDTPGSAVCEAYMAQTTGLINWTQVNTTGTNTNITSSVAPTSGVFSSVILVRNGANMDMYLNAVNVATSGAGPTGDTFGTNSQVFRVGNNVTTAFPMTASADEFIIDLIPWTLADIRKYYTYAKGRFR